MRFGALASVAVGWLFLSIYAALLPSRSPINELIHAAQKQASQKQKMRRQTCPDKPLETGCDFPLSNAIIREIDQRCPKEGACTSGPGTKAQNEIKNNFCAKGKRIHIGIASFDRLQVAVDALVYQRQFTYGTNYVPPDPKDRSLLRSLVTVDVNNEPIQLGEGDLVMFEGVVLDAKHDYSFPLTFSGESVNCNNPALNWNDIHITLGETTTTPDCLSVTAKISPHFRPALWARFDSNPVTSAYVIDPLPVKHLNVRITGQLFFDGSHLPRPCQAPRRRTSWEIHPVYAIEVFDAAKDKFLTFDEWAKDK